MSFLGDLGSGLVGAANSIYNLFTNKRDFDYQKALQQQIFEREDTAVQRRMEDLKAAGINPNLAAGSAAGAGAVVGRSSTNDVNMGSALDTISALNQIKLQKQEQENKKVEKQILDAQASLANVNDTLAALDLITKIDNNADIKPYFDKDGKFHWSITYDGSDIPIRSTPYYKNYNAQVKYAENSNEYLSRELKWYNANQIADMLTGGIGAVSGAVNAGANMKRAGSMFRR